MDHVDHVQPILPPVCRHCNAPLSGLDPAPLRHQVTDIPPIQPEVTEYQLHTLTCPQCGRTTAGHLPPGVPRRQFGPRLQAIVALASGCYRLSKRTAIELLHDRFGVSICLGSISRLEEATRNAVAPLVAEAGQFVQTPAHVFMDETGGREGNQPPKAWLWTAATTLVTVFRIARSRGAAVAQNLLGLGFAGILQSDRWSASNWLANCQRQLGWAHRKRDFQAMSERRGRSGGIGRRLVELTEPMFQWWYRLRDQTMSHIEFRWKMGPVRPEVGALLRQGLACAPEQTAGTCRDILKRESALWTFVDQERVEPTNNLAERALRFGVLWRKGSFGTQRISGSQFVARMLTVRTRLRQQDRNVLEYVTAACRAALEGQPAPSLLPQATAH